MGETFLYEEVQSLEFAEFSKNRQKILESAVGLV